MLVVRDADAHPRGAFDSVCHHLNANGFSVPARAWEWFPSGDGDPALCIAIVPAADRIGALEELVLETVESDAMLAKARAFVDDAYATRQAEWDAADAASVEPLTEEHRGKATAQAYMVTRIADLRELGRAAKKNIWDFNHAALAPLRELLQQMN